MVRERRADAHFLVLTGSPEAVQPTLDKHPHLNGYVTTLTVPAQAVPQYLGCADFWGWLYVSRVFPCRQLRRSS